MSFWSVLLLLAPAVLAGAGVGLLVLSGLQAGAVVVQSLRRSRGRRFAWLYDEADATVTITVEGRRFSFTWMSLVPLGGGIALALLWLHPVLSAWSVVLGIGATAVLHLSTPAATADRRAAEEIFLAAFRSRYSVVRSLSVALRGAADDLGESGDEALKRAVRATLQGLNAGQELDTALASLADYSRLFSRLTTVLQRGELAAQSETDVLLETLEEQARQSRRLAERAKVVMTVVRLTLQVLVVANCAAWVAAPLLPAWRGHYAASPATYIAGTALAMAGFTYFRFRIKTLEESL